MGSPLPTGLEELCACPLTPPDLGPGLQDPRITAALAERGRDPEGRASVRFGSRTRGEARPSSDLDRLISDVATAAHGAGSRWHVLGHIHRDPAQLAGVRLSEDLLALQDFAVKARTLRPAHHVRLISRPKTPWRRPGCHQHRRLHLS